MQIREHVPHEHFIRRCIQHFFKFGFWRSLIETGATEKTAFQNVLLIRIFVSVI